VLNPAAYHGLAGDVVHTILPHTESSPVALLLQFNISFGNAIGRGPFFHMDGTDHFTNEYGVLVGPSNSGRKGTSANHISRVYRIADPTWANNSVGGGISSGEGIIDAIRDPTFAKNKKTGAMEEVDPGVADKRLMIDEREFSGALDVMARPGNIVSRVIREMWDCPPCCRTMTKHNKSRATSPMVSISGHITPHELREKLDRVQAANGYGNRFLYAYVERSKKLPRGGNLNPAEIDRLGAATQQALMTARNIGRVTMTAAAEPQWDILYDKLTERTDDLIGTLTARAAPHTLRLALIYALLDGRDQIDCVHLAAAVALWNYCEQSAHYIFMGFSGDTITDTILFALINAKPDGISTWDITRRLFSRSTHSHLIHEALGKLLAQGKVRRAIVPHASGPGRPAEMWYAV
jgi:hypothetical protein